MERLTKLVDGIYRPTPKGSEYLQPDDGSNAARLLQIVGKYEDEQEDREKQKQERLDYKQMYYELSGTLSRVDAELREKTDILDLILTLAYREFSWNNFKCSVKLPEKTLYLRPDVYSKIYKALPGLYKKINKGEVNLSICLDED